MVLYGLNLSLPTAKAGGLWALHVVIRRLSPRWHVGLWSGIGLVGVGIPILTLIATLMVVFTPSLPAHPVSVSPQMLTVQWDTLANS